MEMINRLSPIITAVNNRAIAIPKSFLLGQLSCYNEEVADQLLVLGLEIVQAWNGLTRDDENVRGSLGVDIVKGYAPIVLIDDVGIDLPVDDLLKHRFFCHNTVSPSYAEYDQTGCSGDPSACASIYQSDLWNAKTRSYPESCKRLVSR